MSAKKRDEFKKRNAIYRQKWDVQFANFTSAPDEAGRIAGLKGLAKLATTNRGLPEGLPLNTLIILCRREKAKYQPAGKWGTESDIAYMGLIKAIKEERRTDLASADD